MGTLTEASEVVDLAMSGLDICVHYPAAVYFDFDDLGLTASFASGPTPGPQMREVHRPPNLLYLYNAIRMCYATVQAEGYSHQAGLKSGGPDSWSTGSDRLW